MKLSRKHNSSLLLRDAIASALEAIGLRRTCLGLRTLRRDSTSTTNIWTHFTLILCSVVCLHISVGAKRSRGSCLLRHSAPTSPSPQTPLYTLAPTYVYGAQGPTAPRRRSLCHNLIPVQLNVGLGEGLDLVAIEGLLGEGAHLQPTQVVLRARVNRSLDVTRGPQSYHKYAFVPSAAATFLRSFFFQTAVVRRGVSWEVSEGSRSSARTDASLSTAAHVAMPITCP